MANEPKSPHEDFILTAVVIFLVFGISWVIWKTFHVQLTDALRWVRVAEFSLISPFVDDGYGLMLPDQAGMMRPHSLQQWQQFFSTAPVSEIDTRHLRISSYLANYPLKVPIMALLCLMGVWAMLRGPGTHFRRRMGLEQLMKEQAKSFPTIAPFLKFNPAAMPARAPGDPVPARLPLFAEALAPEEWVAYFGIPYENGKLDHAQAWRALARQLGPRWKGPMHLPWHARAIYAACALKHVRKREQSDELLNQLARSWSAQKGLVLSSNLKRHINKIVADPKIGGKLLPYVNQHAFQTTALLRALQRARAEGGVIAPASFVWLRGHDRTLWYPLNNLGRKAFHPEAAGALAHYNYEVLMEQPMPSPKFEDVIAALETYLKASVRKIPERKAA